MRTNRPFSPGSLVDLLIHLPDGTIAKAKGLVKMAQKTPLASLKNGMGIELIEKDTNYVTFIQSLLQDSPDDAGKTTIVEKEGTRAKSPPMPESVSADFFIVPCSLCGVKNKVRRSRGSSGVKCGKCGATLSTI
jgi:ribosomal protein S27E